MFFLVIVIIFCVVGIAVCVGVVISKVTKEKKANTYVKRGVSKEKKNEFVFIPKYLESYDYTRFTFYIYEDSIILCKESKYKNYEGFESKSYTFDRIRMFNLGYVDYKFYDVEDRISISIDISSKDFVEQCFDSMNNAVWKPSNYKKITAFFRIYRNEKEQYEEKLRQMKEAIQTARKASESTVDFKKDQQVYQESKNSTFMQEFGKKYKSNLEGFKQRCSFISGSNKKLGEIGYENMGMIFDPSTNMIYLSGLGQYNTYEQKDYSLLPSEVQLLFVPKSVLEEKNEY